MTILNKLLLYGLLLMGVVLLFFGTGRVSTMILAFESFFFAILIAWFLKIRGIDEKYLIFINLGLWLNMAGEIYAYYFGPFLYDKFLHFFLGALLAAIVSYYYRHHSSLKKDAVFLTVLGMLALWEIYEYLLDSFFGFWAQGVYRNGMLIQSALDDTMQDLIWGSIGALAYLIFQKEKLGATIKLEAQKIKREINFFKFLKNLFRFGV